MIAAMEVRTSNLAIFRRVGGARRSWSCQMPQMWRTAADWPQHV